VHTGILVTIERQFLNPFPIVYPPESAIYLQADHAALIGFGDSGFLVAAGKIYGVFRTVEGDWPFVEGRVDFERERPWLYR